MSWVLLGLGLVLIVEGLVYALAPSLVEQLLQALKELPIEARRIIGFVALAVGAALVILAAWLGL
ncbi:MAG: DUF2065 domain-containing protein [Pseudomonadota bacterium]